MNYWWLMTKNWGFNEYLKNGESEEFKLLSNPIYYDKLEKDDYLIGFEANGANSLVTAKCIVEKMEEGKVYIRKESAIKPALSMEQLTSNPTITKDSFLKMHRRTVQKMSKQVYDEIINISTFE